VGRRFGKGGDRSDGPVEEVAVSMLEVIASTTALVLVIVFALGALLVLACGLRGRMEPRRGRCAACRHDLHDPLPDRCGECGHALASDDGVDWGRAVPRGPLCLLGSVLVIVASAALATVAGARGLLRQMPFNPQAAVGLAPDELRSRLMTASFDDPIWNAVWTAADFGELDRAQRAAVFEASARRLVEDMGGDSIFRSAAAKSVLGAAILGDGTVGDGTGGDGTETGRLDDETLRDLLPLLATDLSVLTPTVVRAGEPLFVIPRATLEQRSDYLPDFDLHLEVRRVSIAGVELPHETRPGPRSFAPAGRPGLARFTAPSEDDVIGDVEVEIDVAMILAPNAIGFARPRPPRPAGQAPVPAAPAAAMPPQPVEAMLPTLRRRVEIVGAAESLPRPIADADARQRVGAAITVTRAAIQLDLDGATPVAVATLSVSRVAGLALSFNPVLHIDADPPIAIRLGLVTAESVEQNAVRLHGLRGVREAPFQVELAAWLPPHVAAVPADLRRARLVLTPSLSPHLRQAGAGQWFDGEIVFEDVTLERLDLERDRGDAVDAPGAAGESTR